VLAATDWSNLTVAGAFIGGAILGAVGAIRIMRWVLHYMESRQTTLIQHRERQPHDRDDDGEVDVPRA
jgi:hypothetical protein